MQTEETKDDPIGKALDDHLRWVCDVSTLTGDARKSAIQEAASELQTWLDYRKMLMAKLEVYQQEQNGTSLQ